MSTDLTTNTGMEVTIHTSAGDVKLTPAIVRKYLVNGNGAVTDQEIALFLGLCKAQQLNPFTRECYLIKYGSNQPAAVVVAKDVFLKRAYRSKDFRGHKAGVICSTSGSTEPVYTNGICPPGGKIIGGWAEVHTEGWAFPLRVEVDFNEYQSKRSDGTPNKMWSEKPATMIRKVALVHALREAFPDNFQGMYSEEEIASEELPRVPIEQAEVIDVRPNEPKEDKTERRRRTTKIKVDKAIFGTDEMVTCGSTAEQVTALHALAKSDPAAKEWIGGVVKRMTGYDAWSYLREDEADRIIDEATELFPPPEIPSPVVVQDDMPNDLVDCPNGERVSVGGYCMTTCGQRKKFGWCPAVPGDEPVAGEEMM